MPALPGHHRLTLIIDLIYVYIYTSYLEKNKQNLLHNFIILLRVYAFAILLLKKIVVNTYRQRHSPPLWISHFHLLLLLGKER